MRTRSQQLFGAIEAFRRDRRGATIVEFALVALPFFMLLCAVLETGIIFVGNSLLERATIDAARLIRTGQAQAQAMTQSQFKNVICTDIAPFLSCGNLQVDVEAYSAFGNVNILNPIDGKGNLRADLNNYNIGNAGDIVLVRTFYSWDIVTPLMKSLLGNLSNGDRLLSSASAFRNEPF